MVQRASALVQWPMSLSNELSICPLTLIGQGQGVPISGGGRVFKASTKSICIGPKAFAWQTDRTLLQELDLAEQGLLPTEAEKLEDAALTPVIDMGPQVFALYALKCVRCCVLCVLCVVCMCAHAHTCARRCVGVRVCVVCVYCGCKVRLCARVCL